MAAKKMRLLWNNLLLGSTPTASSEAADFPVEMLLNPWPKLGTLTTGVSAEWWKFDLGAAPAAANYFALWSHDLPASSTIALQANDTDDWGAPAVNQAVTRTADKLVVPITATRRWWRLLMTAVGVTSIEGGTAFLGPHFEFAYDFHQKSPAFEDPSIVDYADDGMPSGQKKDPFRTFDYSFSAVTAADYATLWTIWQTVGKGGFFWIVEDSANPYSTSYYVQNVGPWRFGPIVDGFFTLSFTVREVPL